MIAVIAILPGSSKHDKMIICLRMNGCDVILATQNMPFCNTISKNATSVESRTRAKFMALLAHSEGI